MPGALQSLTAGAQTALSPFTFAPASFFKRPDSDSAPHIQYENTTVYAGGKTRVDRLLKAVIK